MKTEKQRRIDAFLKRAMQREFSMLGRNNTGRANPETRAVPAVTVSVSSSSEEKPT